MEWLYRKPQIRPDLLGINEYPDIASLQKRFKDLGYTNVEVYDMLDLYTHHLDQKERKR